MTYKKKEGITIQLDDREFTIPVISGKGIKKIKRLIMSSKETLFDSQFSQKQIALIADVAYIGLREAHTGIALEQVKSILDASNADSVLKVILEQAGILNPIQKGERHVR